MATTATPTPADIRAQELISNFPSLELFALVPGMPEGGTGYKIPASNQQEADAVVRILKGATDQEGSVAIIPDTTTVVALSSVVEEAADKLRGRAK